jgi:hypothetical protein
MCAAQAAAHQYAAKQIAQACYLRIIDVGDWREILRLSATFFFRDRVLYLVDYVGDFDGATMVRQRERSTDTAIFSEESSKHRHVISNETNSEFPLNFVTNGRAGPALRQESYEWVDNDDEDMNVTLTQWITPTPIRRVPLIMDSYLRCTRGGCD